MCILHKKILIPETNLFWYQLVICLSTPTSDVTSIPKVFLKTKKIIIKLYDSRETVSCRLCPAVCRSLMGFSVLLLSCFYKTL